MTEKKLWELRRSNEAPFNHEEYTVWLHNKILEDVIRELWEFRETKALKMHSSYAACNHIMNLPSMQTIK